METIPLEQIKKRLRALGMKELQIAKFMQHYTYAIERDIPYPLYFAFTKTMN
jgi:hypothetical protein